MPSDLQELLARVSPNDARGYAKAKGWQRLSRDVGRLAIFQRADNELDQLLLPLEPQRSDYADRMADAIVKLVEIEGRPAPAILFDIANYDADVMRFRIASTSTEKGTLPLEDAISLLEGARKSLLSAAHSVLAPQKFHPRLGRSEADDLLKSCRMGQTERGSFTITISCPLRSIEPEARLINEGAESFARQTTSMLAASVHRIWSAIQGDRAFAALEPEADQPVISANLCEAILKMRPERDDAALFFGVSWAAAEPKPFQTDLPIAISFQGDDFGEVENLYDQLKPTAQSASEDFVGRVDELKGELTEQNERQGEVVFSLFDPATEEVLKTRADLNVDQYRLADQLHMSGGIVYVHGRIQRGRRVSRLIEIQKLEQFEPERGNPR